MASVHLPFDTVKDHLNLKVSTHPVLKHKITILRASSTKSPQFRQLLKELTFYLGYETTRQLNVVDKKVQTPLGSAVGHELSEKVALVPILRAGLGMCDAMLELLPMAFVHHIGMYRTGNLLPVLYYNKLPAVPSCDRVIVLEPLIATAGSINACLNLLKDWGLSGDKITVMAVLASTTGLRKLIDAHPDINIVVGEVDEVLTDSGMVMPGVGDVGDRMYCPGNKEKLKR